MKFGYARCSTDETRQDIERQARELIARGAEEIFTEYISGTAYNRPKFDALMQRLKEGDTLATTETSRLTRSMHHLCHIVEDAAERKIKLEVGSLAIDFTAKPDPMRLAMLYMTGVFAEMERGVTVERIKSGIANAKEKGVSMGRPRKKIEDVPQIVKDLLPDYQSGKLSKKDYAAKVKITRPTLYKYLRLLGENIKPDAKKTAADVPAAVVALWAEYQTGGLSKAEYARRTGYDRDTIRKYIRLLQQG